MCNNIYTILDYFTHKYQLLDKMFKIAINYTRWRKSDVFWYLSFISCQMQYICIFVHSRITFIKWSHLSSSCFYAKKSQFHYDGWAN